MLRIVVFTLMMLAAAGPARADMVLEFREGYVTLSARDVPVRQILLEWSRLGNTHVVNADKVIGDAVTLELTRVPEKQALEVLLRSVPGYIAAPRVTGEGASRFARIVVMPPSAAPPPRQPSLRPAVIRPPVMQQQPMPPVLLDDQDQPVYPPGQGMPQDPNAPDENNPGDPTAVPPPQPYPGVQPYAPAGDPPLQEGDESAPPQEATPPGPVPQGTTVVTTPGQIPAPNPNRQPRR
jgi:hypothetical protein